MRGNSSKGSNTSSNNISLKLTVFLHINDDKRSCVWGEGSIVGPVIWESGQLALANLVVRNLTGLLDDGPVIMCRVQDG